MSTPRFYWYPDPDGSLEETDLDEELSNLEELPAAIVTDAYNGDGSPFRAHIGTRRRVRLTLERFGPLGKNDRERDLQAMFAHLVRGGVVGATRDHAKTWASVAAVYPVQRGDTSIETTGNGFSSWSASGTVAAGDEIAIDGASPDFLHEVLALDTLSGNTVSFDRGLRYTYADTAPSSAATYTVLTRWRDFWPVLYLPEDQVRRALVLHERRLTYTFAIELEYLVMDTLALWSSGGTDYEMGALAEEGLGGPLPLRDSSSTPSDASMSVDEILGRKVSRARFGSGRVR